MSHFTRVRGHAGLFTSASVILLAGTALAQEAAPAPAEAPAAPAPAAAEGTQIAQAEEVAPADAPGEEAAPAEPGAEAEAEVGVEAEAQVGAEAEADPLEEPAMQEAPAEAPAVEAAPADAPPAEEGEDPLSFGLFADAYYGLQTADPGTPVPYHRAYAWQSGDLANENGFSLSFLGVDATYDAGEFAATGSLRFGPSVPIFYANQGMTLVGLDSITQAYASWRPAEGVNLDLGQFGTIFGAEVAESWQNLNYSRGGLYYAMQPFWHTGLRGNFEVNEMVTITGMVVNGVNNISEDKSLPNFNGGEDVLPSVAAQVGLSPSDEFSLAAGGLFALNGEEDGSGFDRFFDLVAVLSLDAFTAVFNFDYNMDVTPVGDNTSFLGGSLALGYAFTDQFGIAARAEYLVDADNQLYAFGAVEDDPATPMVDETAPALDESVGVFTGTLTLDFKPVPDSQNLVLRLDGRVENASQDIYFDGDGEATGTWLGGVLGMVVHTD